jgi:hypothetical protein
MSIWDIINPWGALRRERRLFVQAVADYEAERAISASSLRQLRETAEATAEDLLDEIQQLEAILAKGHFRNPETGRIGPVGKVYE